MKINCAYKKLVKVEELIKHPKNPNTHSPKQIELLAKILKATGFRSPIVVSERSGFIVKGHGRLESAIKAGFDSVPVDVQSYENEAEEWADMIADNRIAELSEMDSATLKDLLQELDTGQNDLELTGFTSSEIENMMLEYFPDENKDKENYTNKIEAPKYTPKGQKPEIQEIYKLTKYENFVKEIETLEISQEAKTFLKHSASRHIVFDYSKIAELYSHEEKVMQDMMEKLALVIIDYGKAIENGYVDLTSELYDLAQNNNE